LLRLHQRLAMAEPAAAGAFCDDLERRDGVGQEERDLALAAGIGAQPRAPRDGLAEVGARTVVAPRVAGLRELALGDRAAHRFAGFLGDILVRAADPVPA